jgi:outer membrane protein assembly factor BamB
MMLHAVIAVVVFLLPMVVFGHEGGPDDTEDGILVILTVIAGGPAESAGLEDGDRVRTLAGIEVESMADLKEVTGQYRPGDVVPIVVERDRKTVEIPFTLGEREGRVSLGVSVAVMTPEGADEFAAAQKGGFNGQECLTWIDETYRLESVASTLDYDLGGETAALRTCMENDLERMPNRIPVRWCDNVFKVHCSGLDLLTEIGEAQADWCEEALEKSMGIDPNATPEWTTCAENKIFENFSMHGRTSDADACEAALMECGYESRNETSWLQWGGPARDFRAPSTELAPSWPEDGPTTLWSRSLGDGFSSILAENGRLYTMRREGDYESVVSLASSTGETLWEHRYESVYMGMSGYGTGPRSTPLIVGDRLFTVGANGRMLALDKQTGAELWNRDLWGLEFDGTRLSHGYSSSPVAYEESVIIPVGGQGASLVAFDQATGEVLWKAHNFRNSYSSPAILEIAGETQVVVFMAEQVIGVDPATGELRWQFPHANQWGTNITPPTLIDEDTLFISSPQAGARGLKLTRAGNAIEVEQLWATRRVQFYHAAAVRQGDWIYGSTGTTTPAFMTAINIRTGEIGWKLRGFAKANCVGVDDKLVILDEDGTLYLATASPEKLVVHAKTQLLDRVAWTVPTIVGKTMYVRDRQQILAVDLG